MSLWDFLKVFILYENIYLHNLWPCRCFGHWLPEFLTTEQTSHLLNVSVSNQGRSNSLFLTWEKLPRGVQNVSLALYKFDTNTVLQNGSAGLNATGFLFEGLLPGTQYDIEVTVLLICTQNSSRRVTGRTVPGPVRNVVLSHNSPSMLLASWSEATGGKDAYQLVLYHIKSQAPVKNVTIPRNATTYRFEKLLNGSEYALQITTLAGSYKASTIARHWTAPVVPETLAFQNSGSSSNLSASWSNAGGAEWFHFTLQNLHTVTEITTVSLKRGLTNYTFQHLKPGNPYRLEVSATAGPYRVEGPKVTAYTYPLAPSGITLVSSRWPSSLLASWEIPQGDRDQFFLRFYSQERPLLQRNVTIGPDKQNFTFEGLLPGTQYFLEVSALAGPYRASSQVVSAWTCEYSKLYLKALPKICFGAKHWYNLLWMESGRGREYWVQLYSEESLSFIQNVSVPHGTTQVTLNNLVPGTRYRVEIVSRAGPHYISSQTAIGYTVPLMPLSLMVTSPISSVLSVQWKAPAGQRDKYMVSVSEEGATDTKWHMAIEKANTNTTITGLAPGTCYFIAVWSLAGPYSSASRNDTACTRKSPAPPVNLTLKNLANASVLYTAWAKPPGGRDHYRMILYSLLPPGMERVRDVGPDTQDFLWTGLPAGSQFAVQVTAVKGQAEASSTIAVAWTCPLPPRIVHLSNKGYTDRLNAFWEPTAGGHDGYILTLYYAGSGTVAAKASVEKGVTNFTFTGLIPGSEYLLEVASTAGPHRIPARNVSDWTCEYECLHRVLCNNSYNYLCIFCLSSYIESRLAYKFFLKKGLVPGRNYSVSLSCTAGPYENSSEMMAILIYVVLLQFIGLVSPEPSQVKELQCLPDATSMFLNWTISEGDIEAYELTVRKFSRGGLQKSKRLLAVSRADTILTELTSNTAYQISVSAVGKNGMKSPMVALGCNTSVEVLPPPVQVDIPQFDDSSRVIISPDMFSEDNGLIEYYGVVVTTNESLLRPTQDIISRTWYDHYYGHEDSYLALLLPNPFHLNESTSPKSWPVTVGAEECSQSRETCNGKCLMHMGQFLVFWGFFTSLVPTMPKEDLCMAGRIVLLITILISCRNTHRPIPLQSFRQYYETRAANSNNGFFQDFEELKEVGKDQPKTEAELPANTSKNRYPHVLPYDYSRVKLSLVDEEPHSDYINANFVPGYNSPQEFIATQGPLKKTLDDFWRLVWEQHICTIVMLTVGMENGRVLCEYYWPSDSSPFCSGQIRIHLLAQNFADEWTTREFRIQHVSGKLRRVIHLHYTAWSNHGVPESTTSLNAFVELVRAHMQSASETGPTLVHGRIACRLLTAFSSLCTKEVQICALVLHGAKRQVMMKLFCCVCSRSHPIPLKNFVQHHAKNCSKANAGFLREYEVRAGQMNIPTQNSSFMYLPFPCLMDMMFLLSWQEKKAKERLLQRFQFPLAEGEELPDPEILVGSLPGLMGMLIALDTLLQQLKEEKSVDVYGVVLRLVRSCCLMTPTLFICLYSHVNMQL
uniref:protein-tyrosine-phosphatase n=1 Tax=Anolis carolinensis TaxID=28377 RepID=A0A803TZJ3_ANOCA